MTTNKPESINERLSRLETIIADLGDVVVAQSEAIDALTANITILQNKTANRQILTVKLGNVESC